METVFRIDQQQNLLVTFFTVKYIIGVINTDHLNELPESEEYHSNRESFEYNSFF